MELTFLTAIDLVLETPNQNLHLNVCRQDGQILAQLYNCHDFNRWSLITEPFIRSGIVLELRFTESKTGNAENFKRFQALNQFDSFIPCAGTSDPSFFKLFPDSMDSAAIELELGRIFISVYGRVDTDFELVGYKSA